MSAKLNVNVRTLLANCEQMAKDESSYFRLRKYVKSLDIMIEELRSEEAKNSTISCSKIPDYEKRLNAIKNTMKYVESASTDIRRSKLHITGESSAEDLLNEVRQIQESKTNATLRKELMNEETLRRRRPDESGTGGTENVNEVVKYYNQAQEKITEHMLSLTRSLKEQTETASRIIRKDTEVVSSSTGMTDSNITSLHKETEKLADHSRNAWKCWMWIMIVFVIATFIGMVLFMKIMKKRKS